MGEKKTSDPETAGKVSHAICDVCKRQYFAELQENPRRKGKGRKGKKAYPTRDRIMAALFDKMSGEIEYEVEEHDLSPELAEEKAYELAEWLEKQKLPALRRLYDFHVRRTF